MNILAIVVVSVISMLLGMIWYGPLFGKAWMKIVKLKKKDAKSGPLSMILAFVMSLLMFTILSYFIDIFAITAIPQGIALAAMMWLGFMVPKDMSPVLWQKKSFRLFLINASYGFVTVAIAGAVLAIW